MINTLGLSPSLDIAYGVGSVTAGTIHRPRAVLRLAGGKSLNVSRALSRLGFPVRAIVPLGGRLGELVAERLADTDITLVRVTSTSPTRMCVSATDESAGGLTEFYEHPEPADGTELGQVEAALELVAAGEWLVLSGAVPPGIDLDELVTVLNRLCARGVRLAVDTHGPVLGLLLERVKPALVKINRGEAAELLGADPSDLHELGAAVRRRGGEIVVLTDGAAGALGWGPDGIWSVRTGGPPGKHPVGSGDCFLAGLVGDLAAGRPWPDSLVTAAAVGAANAASLGGAVFDLANVAAQRQATVVGPVQVRP